EIPEIDLILGSHTHHYFEKGEINNGVLMAAAGKYGRFIGEVTIEIENDTVVDKHAVIYTVETLPDVVTHFEAEGKALLSDEVIDHPISIPRRTYVITQTSYMLAESVFEFTNADCTIINAGLIVKGISANQVTEFDIHQMLPHPINAVRIRLNGLELKNVII